jgi:2-polyprenyl-3-methyl-5-hydroxy-6-metoxy-1,4-benzoquinol methylase
MDRDLYTFAAHANLDFANPISAEIIDRALSLLSLPTPARVIDIGCGNGELSIRIARRWGSGKQRVQQNDASMPSIRQR